MVIPVTTPLLFTTAVPLAVVPLPPGEAKKTVGGFVLE